MTIFFTGDEVEWVQCDKCENWYHVVCVGISAQDASKIDEYVCPYCITPVPTPTSKTPMEVDSANTMAGLSVIAQVAHQIISNQEKNEVVKIQPTVTAASAQQSDPSQPPPPPSSLDLNSLICLADVSEKMDSTPVAGENNPPTTITATNVKEDTTLGTNSNQPQPMNQS